MLSSKSILLRLLYIYSIVLLLSTCKGKGDIKKTSQGREHKSYKRFRGSYNSFNDMPDLHMAAAMKKGIIPMLNRADTLKYLDQMIKLPMELDMYKVDKLSHSVPLLVDDASNLLVKIGLNFKDSLRSKKMPAYKLIVTSVTRTQEDVKSLTKRNFNASQNSVHCYGTTFDISWKRFLKIGPKGDDDVSPDKLKLVLAEVLHDLRQREKCYVVHEKKQACFHITVR